MLVASDSLRVGEARTESAGDGARATALSASLDVVVVPKVCTSSIFAYRHIGAYIHEEQSQATE